MAELQAVFIQNLKKERGRLRISQSTLAERAELSSGFIGEIESGRKFPSIDTVERLARALEVPPYRLYMSDRDLEDLLAPEGKPAWAKAALVRWAAEMLGKYAGEPNDRSRSPD
ncbi:MAG TPA: helix-turn-helix transcriptional regulator [Spirochaetia bacterium]|nr:helix-turn-helix transcriptional regulator [Spirochaetales bacterium]HRY81743.1 helix-turn-helix transcriptional regulator [Spirochaetia bacterium]HRZ90173.1 helix-turn-helix transcriptional regulator [Spirochaetia bacterium]